MKKVALIIAVIAAISGANAVQHKTGGQRAQRQTNVRTANYDAYMTVVGSRQGKFRGAGRSTSARIPVISFSQSEGASRDKASGMPSGKRPQGSVTVTIDAVDVPEFQNAMKTNEVLTEVTIEVVKPAGSGKVRYVRTVRLTNATVEHAGVNMNRGKGGMRETEQIKLTYQKIEYRQGSGKVTASDNWSQ